MNDSELDILLAQREGKVLTLTLNRPERLNALTPALHARLHASLVEAADDEGIGAVVLTGAGRAFCSGGDMGSSRDPSQPPPTLEQHADDLLRHGDSARLLHEMPKPTIAMLNGPAAGAGLALALSCDLRVIARGAVLTTAYSRVALSGDLGIGLVNYIEEPEALAMAVGALAASLANGPIVALRYMKQNLIAAETGTLGEVLRQEAFGMARCGRTQDVKEAAAAFREKRPPEFKGR